MKHHLLLLLAVAVSRVDGFWMMMKKKDDGQMMGAGPSPAKTETAAARDKDSVVDNCIQASTLEEALHKATEAETALQVAQQSEEKARQEAKESEKAMKAALKAEEMALRNVQEAEKALDTARKSEEKTQQELKASQDEVSKLRKRLKSDKSSSESATERVEKYHQDILSELTEINANSEKHFNVLKHQIDSEMQRHKEKLRLDHATVTRVEELEKEKAGFLGELKALHQMYDRLENKYDAKMEQEEEEKLVYFAESLDQEVAKIVGERELEWEQTLNETKALAEANLISLRAEMENKAHREVEAVRHAHEKHVVDLEHQIEKDKAALVDAGENMKREVETANAACAKDMEVAEEEALKRLTELQNRMKAEAAKEAAAVKKRHEAEVENLKKEIKKAQDETKRAWEKSEQIDSNLRFTNEERERQKLEYQEIIDGLRDELHEAQEETTYWMNAFATRAYFNSTLLVGDIIMFAEETQVLAIDKTLKVKDRSIQFVNSQAARISKALDPYTSAVGRFYHNHLEGHVKAAEAVVRPVYDKNVAPFIASAQRFRRQKTVELQKALDDAFEDLVALANKRCQSSRKEIESAPKMMRDRMRNVCKDPAVVIRDALRFFAVLFIILFRKVIWRILWGSVRWCRGVCLYFLTFGFFRKKRSSTSANEPAADAKKVEVEEVVAQ